MGGTLQLNSRQYELVRSAEACPLSGGGYADIRVTGATAAPNIDGEVRATGLRADAPYAAGLPPANLTVNAKMRGQAIEAVANLVAGSAARMTLEARLPQGAAGNAPVQASLRGNRLHRKIAGFEQMLATRQTFGEQPIEQAHAGQLAKMPGKAAATHQDLGRQGIQTVRLVEMSAQPVEQFAKTRIASVRR